MASQKFPTGPKVRKVMREFSKGTLRSGQNGSVVRSRAQALAIAASEQRDSTKNKQKQFISKAKTVASGRTASPKRSK